MRRLRLAGLSLALLSLVLLVLSAQAGAAKQQPIKVKQAVGPISTLALDGPRVAYMSHGRAYVWNVLTGATSSIKGKYPSNGWHSSVRPARVDEVAIAGKRVAVLTRFVAGNTQETEERLYTAPVAGWAHQLRSASLHVTDPANFEVGNPGFSTGDWIAGLVGSGNVLAVSSWKSNDSVSSEERLSLVTPTRLRTVTTGPGAIVAQSADGSRIAVLRSTAAWPADGVGPATTTPTVGIYSSDGTLLREISPSSVREVALSGKRLVVLTQANTFEVYDRTTGTLLRTWPVATTMPNRLAAHLAVYGRLAVYAVDPRWAAPRRLHLLDLTTGKDVVIATAMGSGYDGRDAAIGLRGVVYAVNPPLSPGKLVFVPTARLHAMLAATTKQEANKAKPTAHPAWELAMDGPRVAYASGGRISVWNVVTGATSVVKGTYSNAAHNLDAAEIAIAGKQVAWTKRQMLGNTEASERLYTAPVAGRARLIGSAHIGAEHTGWIGGVVGSGHVLAVSSWRWDGTAVTRQRLNLVTPTGLRQIASGPGAIVAASAEGGHIAVLRSTAAWPGGPEIYDYPPATTAPTVGIYSANGALLSEIPLGDRPDATLKIALSGNQLVVLTVTTPPSGSRSATVEVYDWTTGALLHSWPLTSAISEQLLAVSGRLAVLQGTQPRFALHLFDLATGKDVAVAANGWRGIVTGGGPAAISPRGLVYAVNTHPNTRQPYGKLVFVPMAKLLQSVGQ